MEKRAPANKYLVTRAATKCKQRYNYKMKAFLKGNDGCVFTLAPKVTTIGREGCDINLKV